MGEWIVGAAINILGSIGVNLGTNLLKLGHNQREREAAAEGIDLGGELQFRKSIAQFQAWRAGLAVFFIGNCLNFLSFGYAAQSLLAALGSVQFIANIAFAYFVLNETVTYRIVSATVFIVLGNVFLVAFGNHQSPIFTPEQLLENYKNNVYLVYCAALILVVAAHHAAYRKGRQVISEHGSEPGRNWHIFLPFCYAVVSAAIGTHSVLFAKSLSILLRLTFNGENQFDGWFTYLIFAFFLFTASFWMTRLNDALAMFDAILIVPMLQITWTTFSIFTGFIYFQEYRVFDNFRACMFAIGIAALFVGILLLAPQDSVDKSKPSTTELAPLMETPPQKSQTEPTLTKKKSVIQELGTETIALLTKAKGAYKMSIGFGQDHNAASVFSMPMLSSSRSSWRNTSVYREWLSATPMNEIATASP